MVSSIKQSSEHLVYVGIGSNIEQEKHLRLAITCLWNTFGKHCQLQLSPVYQTRAIGFDGDDFFNMVASFTSHDSAFVLEQKLKTIEQQNGRRRDQEKFAARTLDIDLLLFDQDIIDCDGITIPRDEIEKYAFVLAPLADLAPQLIHPTKQQSIAAMWQQLRRETPVDMIKRIDFQW